MSFSRTLVYVSALFVVSGTLPAQSHKPFSKSPHNATSGTSWAMQAMAALTGGNPVNTASESGSVQITIGSAQEQGTITLQSSGVMTSEAAVTTNTGIRSEIRTMTGRHPDGTWIDVNGTPHQMAQHNCWTDAVWFFPALSLLADYADPNLVFTDLGPEQHQGSSVEHIQVYRTEPGLNSNQQQLLMRLSTVDYYLASQTAIPLAVAFAAHADEDLTVNISTEFDFSNYQAVNGILVPYQVIKNFNGTAMLQISLSNVTLNGPVKRPN